MTVLDRLTARRRRQRPPRLRTVTWNAWVGQLPSRMRRNLIVLTTLLRRPHVVVVQEAWRWDGTIPKYIRHAARDGLVDDDTGQSTVIFVREDVPILHKGAQVVAGGEWVYDGNRKQPRVFPRVTVEWDRVVWDIIGIHRIPGGPTTPRPVNQPAWDAEHDLIREWVLDIVMRHPGRPVLLLGDWNTHPDEKGERSLAALARQIDGTVVVIGIDGGILVNCTPHRLHKLTSTYGSDSHRPVVITAEATR
jgi:hypothetical protein